MQNQKNEKCVLEWFWCNNINKYKITKSFFFLFHIILVIIDMKGFENIICVE